MTLAALQKAIRVKRADIRDAKAGIDGYCDEVGEILPAPAVTVVILCLAVFRLRRLRTFVRVLHR